MKVFLGSSPITTFYWVTFVFTQLLNLADCAKTESSCSKECGTQRQNNDVEDNLVECGSVGGKKKIDVFPKCIIDCLGDSFKPAKDQTACYCTHCKENVIDEGEVLYCEEPGAGHLEVTDCRTKVCKSGEAKFYDQLCDPDVYEQHKRDRKKSKG